MITTKAYPPRLEQVIEILPRMASGELDLRIPVSDQKDELDAIAFGINMLAGELQLTHSEIQKISQCKSEFLAALAHEIKTPLSSIILSAQVIIRGVPEDKRNQLLRNILKSSETLHQLTRDLQEVSKIESGILEIEHGKFSLGTLISETVALMEPAACEKGIRLQFECGSTVQSDLIYSDSLRVKQILMNLISNAIKFTSHNGQVRLDLIMGRTHVGDPCFLIEVSDSGVGIPLEIQTFLFKHYVQLGTETHDRNGSGLGLALSKQLALLLKGDLTLAWSKPRIGSCFRLMLPLEATTTSLDPDPSPS